MAQQSLTLQARGLWLQGNNLDAPPGSMSQADDVVISRDNIVEPRRGGATVAGAPALRRLIPYKGQVMGIATSSGWIYADATNSTHSGALPGVPAGAPNRTAEQNGRMLITTASGSIMRLDGLPPAAYPSVAAGVPAGLDAQASLIAGSMLAAGSTVGYRVVWGCIANNGDVMRGPPSGTSIVTNSGGTAQAVQITTTTPAGTVLDQGESIFFEVYRSASTASATPSEEMGLVYTQSYAFGTVIPTTTTFTDTVPDALIGAALYTSPSQEGIVGANYVPPFALDLAAYRSSVFYANATPASRITAKLLGVGAPGLQNGDTITITTSAGSIAVTGGAAENIGTLTFLVASGGTAQQNVASTSDSIIRVLNRGTWTTSRSANVRLLSAATDPAGIIGIEANQGLDLSFSCSRAGAFLQQSITQTWASQNRKNALYWSKGQQPEAVPLLNYATLGSADKAILRIVPTRDSLFIFKEDGLWRLTGDSAPWTIAPFDPTCILKVPESAVMLDNSVFALTNQGVVRVTDTGVQVVSRAIETAILPLLSPSMLATTTSLGFGVAYESARKYYLWLPSTSSSTTCDGGAYVYDLFTQTWVHDTRPMLHAIVNPADDRLWLTDGANVWQERKGYMDSDYADGANPINTAFSFLANCGNSPGTKHHFSVLSAMFRKIAGTSFSLTFDTELSAPATTTYNVADYNVTPGQPFTLRTWVPLEQSRASQLTVGFAQSVNQAPFQFQGMSLLYRPTSEEAGY